MAGAKTSTDDPVQRWLCRNCGYRFSERGVESSVAGKLSKTLDSGTDHFQGRLIRNDFSVKETSNDFSLFLGKDVTSHEVSTVEKGLNSFSFYNRKHQVCVSNKGAKNLDTATETKTVAAEIGKAQQEIEVKIVQYDIALENKGRSEETRRTYVGALYTLMHKGANLFDPVTVEETIAKQPKEEWSIRAKKNYTDWYCPIREISED
jgi:hypothetical protein